jgi:DNA adenine methylase
MANKTPLRYPGGKQRLSPFILELMELNDLLGGEYAEPYAGGAGVAMDLLLAGNAAKVHLNDSCLAIYSFWRSILDHTEEFCKRLKDTPLTVKTWKAQREIISRTAEYDQLDVGFSTFYLNRCNRSGIIAGGGLIGGLKQTGKWKMDARFPRERLIERIVAIASKRDSITVTQIDAEDFIAKQVPQLPEKVLVYCDPPYFKKAHGLYFDHYEPHDHERVAGIIKGMQRPWIVSYDNVPKILSYYSERRRLSYRLQHTASTARKGKEVFFFADSLTIPKYSAVRFLDRSLKRLQNVSLAPSFDLSRRNCPSKRPTKDQAHGASESHESGWRTEHQTEAK